MRRLSLLILIALVTTGGIAPAMVQPAARAVVNPNGDVPFENILLGTPAGWKLTQDAKVNGTLLLTFSKGEDFVAFYVRAAQKAFDMKGIFANGSTVVQESTESYGPLHWNSLKVSHRGTRGTMHLVAFSTEWNGSRYYGYSRSPIEANAAANARSFLSDIKIPLRAQEGARSLTGADYTGKKYYLGWGAAGGGDPSMMQNEVKYDVLHTHDIFTQEIGGNYIGSKMTNSEVSSGKIRAEWERLQGLITSNDMYVQYSSGHGSPSGLGVGVSYSEIRDNVLQLQAKEIVVFTMACYSGNLVKSFDQKKSEWEDWQTQGRTLFVMSSSKPNETSSTGPGTDPDESGGPNGSAGSAFGHALWKALIGYADGAVDGVQDGFLSLEEIRDFTVEKTKQVGDHTPVYTGAYTGTLVMNKVPSKEFLATLEGSTEGLTDEEVMERIQALDREMRIQN